MVDSAGDLRQNWRPGPGQDAGQVVKASQLGAVGGAPVNGAAGTGAGYAAVGAEYVDDIAGTATSGQRWTNTGTMASPVWSLIIT